MDVPLFIDRFENTPYLTADEIGLLHGNADLNIELAKVSRVILRIGFVACGSELTLTLDREWKASNNICGTTIENLQAVTVTEARLHSSARGAGS